MWAESTYGGPRWRDSGDLFGFVLVDPFDELLRVLSPQYFRDALSKLSNVLAERSISSNGLALGWLHNGVADRDDLCRNIPSAFLGWLFVDHPGGEAEGHLRRLDETLVESSPRLASLGAHRSILFDCPADDGEAAIQVLLEDAEDPTEWSPDWLEAGLVNGTLFAKIIRALGQCDDSTLTVTISMAEQEYSADGLRLLKRGIATWKRYIQGQESAQ